MAFLEQCYRLKKLTLDGYTHPEVLATYPLADSICLYYAAALTKGGTALLDAWLTLTRAQMARNGSPQDVWARYEADLQRTDKLEIARSEVMIYGWWNSANHRLPHADRYLARSREFRKVFSRVKQHDCDEP